MIEAEHSNRVEIAVLKEQISGLREQHRAHNESTQKRFDTLEEKVDSLVAVMNRGRGAYAASMVLAGVIGAVILKYVAWALGAIHVGPK